MAMVNPQELRTLRDDLVQAKANSIISTYVSQLKMQAPGDGWYEVSLREFGGWSKEEQQKIKDLIEVQLAAAGWEFEYLPGSLYGYRLKESSTFSCLD